MKLSVLNSKPCGGKSLRDIIDQAIGVHFYPTTGPEHYKILHLDKVNVSTYINDNRRKSIGTKIVSFV